jgi:hypothetical protein
MTSDQIIEGRLVARGLGNIRLQIFGFEVAVNVSGLLTLGGLQEVWLEGHHVSRVALNLIEGVALPCILRGGHAEAGKVIAGLVCLANGAGRTSEAVEAIEVHRKDVLFLGLAKRPLIR